MCILYIGVYVYTCSLCMSIHVYTCKDSRLKTQKYLFDHYLHFLKLHIIINYINSLFLYTCRPIGSDY